MTLLGTSPSASSAVVSPARTRPAWLFGLAVTLPFLVLFWINLWHHEIWFDEINAWGIACAASTLGRLFYYVHFEGHPWLWYFILWIPSRFTHNPIALKWVEGIFGTAIYLVIGLLSPFTRLQKLLIFTGYYVIFEYTVMSRMYSVMFLLALLYVCRRARKPDAVIGNVALLGAIANTDMTGVILSGALLVEYAYDRWMVRRQLGWTADLKRRAGLAILAYAGLLGFSIHSLYPARNISWQASGHIGSEMFQRHRIVQSIGNLVAAPWWPISKEYPRSFWGTDSLHSKGLLLLVPVILYAYWKIFRGERSLQLLMGATLAFGILFADVVYWGSVRHWGIAFVSFLLALWMQSVQREQEGYPGPVRWSRMTYGLMTVSAVAGVLATVGAWLHPFNQLPAIAGWIRTHEPANVLMTGDQDWTLASVAEELQRPVYFMECGCTDTFKLFTRDRDKFDSSQLPSRLDLALRNMHTKQLLLVNYNQLTPDLLAQLQREAIYVEPLKTFQGLEKDDHFYLYHVTRR